MIPSVPSSEFSLRFPFRPLHWIEGLEEPINFEIEGILISLSACSPYAVLYAKPFVSEETARAFLPRLWGALAWVAVKIGTGFRAEMEVDRIIYAEDPEQTAANLSQSLGLPNKEPVHGIVNGNFPAVLPIGKNIRFMTLGDMTVTSTLPKTLIEGPLSEGLRAPSANSLYDDERLRTAVELFCASHSENSLQSKFLTLVMGLEVLTRPDLKHNVAQKLLNGLEKQVTKGLAKYSDDSDEWHALDSLKRELLFRRETSLRSRVRHLVLNGLPAFEPSERKRRARDAVWAYDVRGTLVHDGTVPKSDLSKAYDIAHSTIRDLLVARMQ